MKMTEIIDIKEVKEDMIGYYLVSKIYDIRDNFIFTEPEQKIEYKYLKINHKILDYIREVNFIFIKDIGIVEDIKEYTRIGLLMNFQVFLDPKLPDNEIVMFSDNNEQDIEINILY